MIVLFRKYYNLVSNLEGPGLHTPSAVNDGFNIPDELAMPETGWPLNHSYCSHFYLVTILKHIQSLTIYTYSWWSERERTRISEVSFLYSLMFWIWKTMFWICLLDLFISSEMMIKYRENVSLGCMTIVNPGLRV